jgi:hypothetical protein
MERNLMGGSILKKRTAPWLGVALAWIFMPALLPAQVAVPGLAPAPLQQDRGGYKIPGSSREAAPEDLTGYWVSLVTEDWRFRMVTPAKGDYESIPLNAEGIKFADSWDPAKDEATGNACKAYAAAAIMRVPGRLHITWENDTTLRIDADAGTQTRVLHFGGHPPSNGEPQWQGYSSAEWQLIGDGRAPPRGGYLKVETTHMRPGYLRRNGVPVGGNAVLTEYFTRVNESDGNAYLIVTSVVNDPQYLNAPFTTSTHFKKLPDAAGWRPTPCKAR